MTSVRTDDEAGPTPGPALDAATHLPTGPGSPDGAVAGVRPNQPASEPAGAATAEVPSTGLPRMAQPVVEEGPSPAVTGGATPAAGAGDRRRSGRRVVGVAALAGALLAGGATWLLEPGAAGAPTVRITARYSRFEPDRVKVKPGETVKFVIHNADPIDHEFIIGPPETHDIHERGAPHVHTGVVPGEVTVPAGTTVETTWTFAPSSASAVEYGCHLSGHWTYGMHGKALVG